MADTSTSYKVDVSSLNGGGNFAKSTTYHLDDTIVGFVNGQMGNSAAYTLGSGLAYLELFCANNIVEFGETCDDGNLVNGDGCNNLCQLEAGPVCGNGIITAPETCDDGNLVNGDGCSNLCLVEPGGVCGNGVITAPEACDDGNLVNGDGCSATCVIEIGGGGGGGGGGYLPVCGNGLREASEVCDDGNRLVGDGCDNQCKQESVFRIPVCGNRIKEAGETCDDGNRLVGDGCDSQCAFEKVEEEEVTETGNIREIRIIAHPEKRVNAPQNWGTVSRVVFYNRTLRKTMLTTTVGINDTGWGSITTSKLDEGMYDISLKGYSHLTRVLRGIRIDQAIQTIDFSQGGDVFLIAGDVHESKDDFINGLDISATVNELYSTDIGADLNHDGLVNALDLSIVVGNIYKYGEKIKI